MPFPHGTRPRRRQEGKQPERGTNIPSSSSSSFQEAVPQRPAARLPPAPQAGGGRGHGRDDSLHAGFSAEFPCAPHRNGCRGPRFALRPLRPPPRLRLAASRTTRDGASAWTIPEPPPPPGSRPAQRRGPAARPAAPRPQSARPRGPPPPGPAPSRTARRRPRPHWCVRPSVTAAAGRWGRAEARSKEA